MIAPAKDKPTERSRQADLMRRKREDERDIQIPEVVDPKRRAACLADPFLFLATYFADRFFHPWTWQQREMVDVMIRVAKRGGAQSIAAPRGEGKTTLAELVAGVYCVVSGTLKFPVIVAATGTDAERILSNIKTEYEFNDLLADDFPEVCYPVRALEGAPQRCGMQTVGGERTRLKWSGSYVAFPRVPKQYGSKCAGTILMTRGLDAAIRGIRVEGLRPDFVLIDDPETAESARSDTQSESRELTIDRDLAGLAGPGRKIGRLMLTTIQRRRSLSAKFTDPHEKPAWNGKRYRLMESEPTNRDLWEQYVDLRQQGMEAGSDPDGVKATAFYVEHREAMDAGAKMANPARYIAEFGEVSALQHFWNLVADLGWSSVLTEYQNDPPADGEPEQDGLSESLVRGRLTGVPHREVPDDAKALVAFVDLGKWRLHWGVATWANGAIGDVIDYGEKRTANPEVVGTETAILTALEELADEIEGKNDELGPYCRSDGEVVPLTVGLIDAGNWNTVVYDFCLKRGGVWRPSMGDPHFHAPKAATKDKRPGGEFWYLSRQPYKGRSVWVVNMDPDRAKRWMQDRLLTPTFEEDADGNPVIEDGKPKRKRGSLALFGNDRKRHGEFADHVLAERFEREFKEGKAGMVERWVKVRPDNHYLDVLYGCCVGASIAGVRLLGDAKPAKRKRVSLAELQQARRAKA